MHGLMHVAMTLWRATMVSVMPHTSASSVDPHAHM